MIPIEALANLDEFLEDVIEKQRSFFGSKACPAIQQEAELDAAVDPDNSVPRPRFENDAKVRFAPCDAWRRPSDYVKYLDKRFEQEWINPRSGKKEP